MKTLFKLKDDELKFSNAIRVAQEVEEAAKVAKETVHGQPSTSVQKVYHAKSKTSKTQEKKTACFRYGNSKKTACFRYGNSGHFSKACPHIKAICSFCKKTGHLQSVCMSQGAQSKFTRSSGDDEVETHRENLSCAESTATIEHVTTTGPENSLDAACIQLCGEFPTLFEKIFHWTYGLNLKLNLFSRSQDLFRSQSYKI